MIQKAIFTKKTLKSPTGDKYMLGFYIKKKYCTNVYFCEILSMCLYGGSCVCR